MSHVRHSLGVVLALGCAWYACHSVTVAVTSDAADIQAALLELYHSMIELPEQAAAGAIVMLASVMLQDFSV